MIEVESLDRLTVIVARLVGGDAHLLTEEDLELINEACVHAEDVLSVKGEDYVVSYKEDSDNEDLDEDYDLDYDEN